MSRPPISLNLLAFDAIDYRETARLTQFIRFVDSLESEALKQIRLGNVLRSRFLGNYVKKNANLTNEEFEIVKEQSQQFTRLLGCRSLVDDPPLPDEMESSAVAFSTRQLAGQFRRILGDAIYEKILIFLRNKLVSPNTEILSYFEDGGWAFSFVEYDPTSNEVVGHSGTDWPPGHCESVENTVIANFSSDQEGVIETETIQTCGSAAETYFYFSNPTPGDRFCVDAEHYFSSTYWLPRTIAGNRVFDRTGNSAKVDWCMSGKIEPLPPSSDCIVVPLLPNVTSVTYQMINQGTMGIDANPNTGGGQRIFPDKDSPSDTVNRQQIRVTAQIGDNQPGVTVYFRNFDLDDPSADNIIDPNGNDGDDNNGSVNGSVAGQLSSASAVTNSSGQASVTFTVTRQPGDNFAIVAGVDQAAVSAVSANGIDLLAGNGASIDINCDGTDLVCRSEMLTVWRRLHIEVDSMGDSAGNFALGNFGESTRIGVIPVEVQINVANQLAVNRFENGRLVSNNREFVVVSNTENSVTLRRALGGSVRINQSELFQLYDDDDFDDDGGLLNGDTGEDIPEPDTSLLTANSDDPNTNFLATAYVRPVYDVVDTRDNSIYAANVESTSVPDRRALFVDWDSESTNTDIQFWSVYLLGAYQYVTERDNDPNSANVPFTLGIVDAVTGFTGEGSGALIFSELHRPSEFAGYSPSPTDLSSMAVTVAHEVGHLFSCRHGDGGLMGDDLFGNPVSNQLSPLMVRRIRVLDHP